MLYWQGDLVEATFVAHSGSLKEYILLADGRAYAYRLLSAHGFAAPSDCSASEAARLVANEAALTILQR